jgi:hypothetical protein
MVNMYVETAQGDTKGPAVLYRTPGLSVWKNAGIGEVRGLWEASDSVLYAVVSSAVYKIVGSTDPVLIGSLYSTSGIVSIRDNGNDLLIVDGTSGYQYKFDTEVFSEVADEDFPKGCKNVAYIDGYYIVQRPGKQEFLISGINDGYTWDALDISTAEGKPDPLVVPFDDHRELWLFGTQSTEVFYNSGNVDFPFERISGAFIEHGCASPYSVAKIDNSVFWLSSDTNGTGMVYRANGYQPVRVSTHAIEAEISSYETLSDARSFAYQEDGHSFYCLIFPSAGKCWVYDAASGAWHERASFLDGDFIRWRANCSVFHNGKMLVGDFENGNIYQMSNGTHTENGQPMKWLRSFRAPNDENMLHSFAEVTADMEVATSDTIMIRYSDDGGNTWSDYRTAYAGDTGQFNKRVIWRRLGIGRDRVFEVSGYTSGPVAIVGMYARVK